MQRLNDESDDIRLRLMFEKAHGLVESGDLRKARAFLEDVAPRDFEASAELRSLENLLAPPEYRAMPASSLSRRREFAWLQQHGHEHRQRWLAVEEDRLLVTGETLAEISKALERDHQGSSPLVHWVG